MIDATKIANMALSHLGESQVLTSLDVDNTTQAKKLRLFFDVALEITLRKYDWEFATAHTSSPMVLKEEGPSSGFAYAYSRPARAVRVRQIAPKRAFHHRQVYEQERVPFKEYRIGLDYEIHTNLMDAYAEYTPMLSTKGVFPTHFGWALASVLAKVSGPSIITNNFGKIKGTLDTLIDSIFGEAISLDLSSSPQGAESPPPFIQARYRD